MTSGNDCGKALRRSRAHLAALPKTDEEKVVQMAQASGNR